MPGEPAALILPPPPSSRVILYALADLSETIEIFSTREDRCLRRFRSVEEKPDGTREDRRQENEPLIGM